MELLTQEIIDEIKGFKQLTDEPPVFSDIIIFAKKLANICEREDKHALFAKSTLMAKRLDDLAYVDVKQIGEQIQVPYYFVIRYQYDMYKKCVEERKQVEKELLEYLKQTEE